MKDRLAGPWFQWCAGPNLYDALVPLEPMVEGAVRHPFDSTAEPGPVRTNHVQSSECLLTATSIGPSSAADVTVSAIQLRMPWDSKAL